MKRLIKAEYRKIFSTKLWWALLIPAAVLSLAFTWGGAALGTLGEMQSIGAGVLPLSLPAFAQGINFATVFALILGGTAVTGEMRHKTITTSYLTGPTRGAVLTAKQIVYASIGAVYGVTCMIAATFGALFGDNLPDAGDWFTLAAAGVLAMSLWTLLGVGIGALIGNQVGTTLGATLYVLVVEPILAPLMRGQDLGEIPPYLPNTSGSNMVSTLSFDLFFDGLPGSVRQNQRMDHQLRSLLGLEYSPAWWVSALVFAGYAVVLGTVGWLVAKRRDIT
jgi:ABC-2 type transport system permease protein